jgi:hypothetical protein
MAYSKHVVEKRLSIWEYAAEQREVAKKLLEKCKEREKQLQKVKSS